jgi:ubiquinone/menaquinone biosynthesis C-methylase UbiE
VVHEPERQRLLAEERRRVSDPRIAAKYNLSAPGVLFAIQQAERSLIEALHTHHMLPLDDKRILDVGCGSGALLLSLARFGAALRNCFGVDLHESVLRTSQARNPGLHLVTGDIGQLPFAEGSFDLVTQFTVFTSILDSHTRRVAALEMQRVLRPSGAILWYDFWMPSPWSATRPILLREIRALFPGFRLDARRVTLLPPLARVVAARTWIGGLLLEQMPLLRSHYLVVLMSR